MSGKLRAKSMKFKDGYMIYFGHLVKACVELKSVNQKKNVRKVKAFNAKKGWWMEQ